MAQLTGTIDLESVRYISFISRKQRSFTIELYSEDLSDDTTFSIQQSVGGTNFDTSQDAGTDISETLSDSTAFCKSYECDPGIYFKVVFEGATTGNVSYKINL